MALTKEVMLKILASDSDAQAKLDAIAAKADELREDNPELVARIDTAEASAKLAVFRDELKEAAATADEMQAALDDYSSAAAEASDAAAKLAAVQADDTASAQDLSAALDENSAAALRALDAQMRLIAAEERSALAAQEAGDAQLEAAAKTGDAGKALEDEGDEQEGMLAKLKLGSTAMLGLAAAIGVTGYESIKMSADFQRSMEMIVTQAGVPQKALAALKAGVLSLAGQVGIGPTSLSQALYHIESSFASVGITGTKALSLLKIAAEGAQVGGANLVDVTNALDATIVAGVGGVKNYSQAMGALNAIVGAGDMTMEDLAQAMGTGVMGVAKSYGQTIQQVGAALAVFGDNNIRGAKAGTDLRMVWQALQAPLAAGIPLLQKLGLGASTLAQTMEHHGMSDAIAQFIDHLKASKVPLADWGQMVTEIFGKRAGVGIGLMVDQLGRLESKFPDINKGADGFASAWARTRATVSVELDQLKATFDALMITIGDKVLPVAESFLKLLAAHSGVALKIAAGVGILVGALGLFTATTKVAGAAAALFDVELDANPIGLIVLGIAALVVGLVELYKHFKTVRDVVADAGHVLSDVWNAAMAAAGAITKWFADGPLAYVKKQIGVFTSWWHQNGAEITKIWDAVWTVIAAVAKVEIGIIKTYVKVWLDLTVGVFKAAWDIVSGIVKMNWDVIATVISTTIHVVLDVISAVLDIIQGKWSAAGHELMDATNAAFHGIVRIIETIVSGFGSLLVNAGRALIGGLINGIESAVGGLFSTISNLAGGISHAFGSVLKIFSPSKVFREHGHMIVEGLRLGIEDYAPMALSAAEHLATGLSGAVAAGQYRAGAAGGGGMELTLEFHMPAGGAMLPPQFWTEFMNGVRAKGGDPRIVLKKVRFA